MAKARDGGWARIQRKLIKSDLWLDEPFTRGQAWVDLILLAAHKASYTRIRGVRVDVERGQLATALRFLATRWRWSVGKVQRFLDELETDKQIGTQKNNVSTTITITNYDTYQGNEYADDNADGTQIDTQTSTQTGTQTEQIQEGKELKKEKKVKKGDTPLPPVELPPSIRTEAMQSAVDDWLAYKRERREGYKPTGLRNFLSSLSGSVAVHGEAAIIAKLRRAMAQGWRGWDFADPPPRGSPAMPAMKLGPSHVYDPNQETRDEI